MTTQELVLLKDHISMSGEKQDPARNSECKRH